MRRARRNSNKPTAASGPTVEQSRLGGLAPVHVDYDEARSSEERSTYHQPRLAAQGEFFLDAHPVRRLRSLLGRRQKQR